MSRHIIWRLPGFDTGIPSRNISLRSWQWYPNPSGLDVALASYFHSLEPSYLLDAAVSKNRRSPAQQGGKIAQRLRIFNPLASLKSLWAKDTALITTT